MLSEPVVAHPPEIGGVHDTGHSDSWEEHDCEQRDDEDEQHMVVAVNQVGVNPS